MSVWPTLFDKVFFVLPSSVVQIHLLRKEYQSSMFDLERELSQVREMVGDIAQHLAKRSNPQTQVRLRGHVYEKSLLEMRL